MDLVLHTTRYNLRAALRNKRARVLTLVFPLVMLAMLAGVFGDGHTMVGGAEIDYARFFVPSVLVFAVTTSTLGILVGSVVQSRELGILKRRQSTPLPAWGIVVSQSLTVALVALGSVAALLAVAAIAFDIAVPAAGVPALLAAVIFGCAAFCGVGWALSTLADSAESTQPMIQVVLLPLFFVSGVWVPLSELPGWLGSVASVFPVEHVADLAHRAFVGSVPAGDLALDVAVLAAWGIAGGAFAARRFVWLPTRRG